MTFLLGGFILLFLGFLVTVNTKTSMPGVDAQIEQKINTNVNK
jgi:hypothetical protein